MTDEKLAELRAKAEAASPGPWHWDSDNGWICAPHPSGDPEMGVIVIDASAHAAERPYGETTEDVEHIVAFDPTTVLELLDEIRRLREENEELKFELLDIDDDC